MKNLILFVACMVALKGYSQQIRQNPAVQEILANVSASRLEADVRTLAGFGTRHTMSDTTSEVRGIGAARRWIKSEFEAIAETCGGCLEVYEQRTLVKGDEATRITKDTWVVNVYAVLRGQKYPDRYVVMSGDIDSRASDVKNYTIDAPGANDNATGMAAALELARVLSGYSFDNSIVLAGLSGEEQGLYGGRFLAEKAKEEDWEVVGVLNNDMIGNIEGVDGVIDNRTFRIFSEPFSSVLTERQLKLMRFYGGENDGVSRQLARYIYETTKTYLPEMKPMLIYRLDRFGRGGHHRPFNELGFAGVRIMEAHENYNRQHQDLRQEDGIAYGDVVEGVDFDYCAKLTGVNAAAVASLAWAPPAPQEVAIGGIVEPAAKLSWQPVEEAAGYKIYWRSTTAPTWEYSKLLSASATSYTLTGIVLDNYLFGVVAIDAEGNESVVSYPQKIIRE
ncbi:M28 family peptidase [Marinoscillum furvescens]|uniref:Peptidase M28-like protein n=1 Tax=Marinoscillum furvescens DSM 4134 TaxID=1122208 RepID=A0A3D9KXZ3_MARFU|nr:M28 family metallopeptidase [Marinoscillum furvescens]RED93018.1 peptidase M28-like protein [Marinoscillum furvescens DSM 4134]